MNHSTRFGQFLKNISCNINNVNIQTFSLPFFKFLVHYIRSSLHLFCVLFYPCKRVISYIGPIVYRLGHQVFQPKADHPLGGILAKTMFYVYVLKSTVKEYHYIGSTEDLRRRVAEHNSGKTKSIKHLIPFRLVYYEAYTKKTLARKREIELKRNSYKKQEMLGRI